MSSITNFKYYVLFLLLQNNIPFLSSVSLSSPWLAAAFMSYSKLQVKTNSSKNHRSNRKWSMYFDDISRSKYTVSWNDESDDNGDNGIYFSDGRQGFRTNIDGTENKYMSNYYAEQKLDALQKSLYGYDPLDVSDFSIVQVEKDMLFWYENTDIGRTFFQMRNPEKDFESNNEIIICRESTFIGCIAFLWRQINNMYTERRINDNGNGRNGYKTMTIVFPYCKTIYDYETMSKWYNSILKCQEVCSTFGQKFNLSIFHPRYKNIPKMLSLARHSPFPSFILHNHDTNIPHNDDDDDDTHDVDVDDLIFGRVLKDQLEKTRGKSSMMEDEENEMDAILKSYINQRRDDFEKIFNSEAAFSPTEGESNNAKDSSGFNDTFIKRKDSDQAVIATMNDWISNNKENKDNKALQFAGTNDDRWTITKAASEEELYSEIWDDIYHLYTLVQDSNDNITEDTDAIKGQIVRSTMFITTKYSLFNANRFKRFAVTVNGMLKQININAECEMFLELFHPEYVGKKSCKSPYRRSPFPALQICYRRTQEKQH